MRLALLQMLQKSLKVDVEDETFDLENRPVAAHGLLEQIQLATVHKASDEIIVAFICRKQNGLCAQETAKGGGFATSPDVIVASVGGFQFFCVDKRCPAIQAECRFAPGTQHCCTSYIVLHHHVSGCVHKINTTFVYTNWNNGAHLIRRVSIMAPFWIK